MLFYWSHTMFMPQRRSRRNRKLAKLLLVFTVAQSMIKNMPVRLFVCDIFGEFLPISSQRKRTTTKVAKISLEKWIGAVSKFIALISLKSFLEFNSKRLFLCYEKSTTSLSCVYALHKTWNKAVTARRSGAACDSIKM